MTKKIQPTEATLPQIRDTAGTLERISHSQVDQALGAEETSDKLMEALAPVTLFAVRAELSNRLQSSGGRPALAGTTRRAKIPLSNEEWDSLEKLAVAITSPGFAPSAGQVASILLTLSLQAVMMQIGTNPIASPLTRQLEDLARNRR
jgi:hypothetical protein